MTTFYWILLLFVTNIFSFVAAILWTIHLTHSSIAEEHERLHASKEAWEKAAKAHGISL